MLADTVFDNCRGTSLSSGACAETFKKWSLQLVSCKHAHSTDNENLLLGFENIKKAIWQKRFM